MSHSYTAVRIHYVFSTKERMRVISKHIQPRLWAFIGGIAKSNVWCRSRSAASKITHMR
ncbi:MAG TPA: hypothetical protein VNR20_05575 [Terriglobales bacterium]|nr:hypothetical protein [Terriglobales bacterium]